MPDVADPTQNTDAANKGYVDNSITKVENNVTNITNQLGNLPLSYIKTVKEDGKDVVKRLVAGSDGQLYFADSQGKAIMTDAKGKALTPQVPDGIMLVQPGAKDTVDTVQGQKLGNVADGEVAAGSKEAVNGGQLHDVVKNTLGLDVEDNKVKTPDVKTNADGTKSGGIGNTGEETVNNAITVVNNKADKAVKTANDAKNTANEAKNTADEAKQIAKNATRTKVKAGKNIVVTPSTDADGSVYTVGMKDDVAFNKVTINGGDGSSVTMTTSKDDDGQGGSISVLNVGTEEAPTRIRGVADGVKDTDAVNVRQLESSMRSVSNYLDNKINKVEKHSNAGTASAIAVASLPQAADAGKSMFSIAGGSYEGETATAVGISRRSDNGKVILKANGTFNSRGKMGVGVGVGFQW